MLGAGMKAYDARAARLAHRSMPSDEDDDGSDSDAVAADHAATDGETPMDTSGDAVPGKTGCVKEGYEGRARRGVGKVGGYDAPKAPKAPKTPKRRGPRKKKGVRMRYVEEDERGGGTTEQGIRMGPVSVQRVAKERGRSTAGAATPLHDPG